MPEGPTSLRVMSTFFLMYAVWGAVEPGGAPRAGGPVLARAELDQDAESGDPVDVVLDDHVRLAGDLQGRLVVVDVRQRDVHVVGEGGRPLVVADLDVPFEPRVDHVQARRRPRLHRVVQRLVEVDPRDVAGRDFEALAVVRLPDHGERGQLELLAVVQRLVLACVDVEPALGVVNADLKVFARGEVVGPERLDRQVSRLPLRRRLGLHERDRRPGRLAHRPRHQREQPHVPGVTRHE